MTIPRKHLVDPDACRFYHCISRCVRSAFLCGHRYEHRRLWIRQRLQNLADVFAIDIAGYAILSNHLHIVVRLDPDRAERWSGPEIAERWLRLYPRPKNARLTHDELLQRIANDEQRIAVLRQRLASLSWFMKCLKEPIARRANREDDCRGCFWEGRFKSPPLLDDPAILSCLVYIDLNVIRAALASTPEQSDCTSVQDRIHLRQLFEKVQGLRSRAPARARRLLRPGHTMPRTPEDGIWLAPIQIRSGQRRPGLLPMTLDEYLQLVDATGRLARSDKRGEIPDHLRPILRRLELDTERWVRTMSQGVGRMVGTAIGSVASRAREAARRGSRWVVNALDVYASLPTPT